MKVSVLIHNLDRAEALARCLESVLAQTHRPLEAVVLDAGSTDGSLDVIAEYGGKFAGAGIDLVLREVPLTGVATSRNMAARLATGELLCGLDNDGALDSPDTLARGAARFRAEPSLGVVSFRVLLRDTPDLDPSCWIYRRPASLWSDREFETFTFTGGAFLGRTQAFWNGGGFWDLLVYSREEEELCLGLMDQGRRILYCPDLVMRHHPGSHAARDVSRRRFVELQNGLLVFWRRFPWPAALAMGAARIVSMSLRLLFREKGSLASVLAGLPSAVRLWRADPARRAPVSWRTFLRYLALHRAGGAGEELPLAVVREDGLRRVNVLGCPFDKVSFQDTVDRVEQALATGRKLHIATGNLDFVMRARRDPAVARELWETDLVVADGVPVLWAAGLLGEPLKGRVNGTDLVWECARVSARTGAPLALVGAMPEAARSAARRLAEHAPGAVVHAIDTPYPLGPEENRQVVADIRAKGGRIVLVALGAPKQERWIRGHLEECGGVVGIGIGSAFDLISGTKRRAPAWMQRHGFEWLHRMAQEPGRLGKRYLVDDLPFFWYLLKELFRRRFGGANRPGAGQEDR